MNVLETVLDVLIHHDDAGKHKYYRALTVICAVILFVLVVHFVFLR
jgi:hypothetical protein